MFFGASFKKIFLFFLIAGMLSFQFGCKYSNSPDAVVRKFLISFNRLDFVTAKSVSTRETWEVLDIMEAKTKDITAEQKEMFAKEFSVKILKVQELTDSITLVTFETTPKRLPFNEFKLYKTYNKNEQVRWKVDVSTLDLLEQEQDEEELLIQPVQELDNI